MGYVRTANSVMPGLEPGIHDFLARLEQSKTWMAGPSPAMTDGPEMRARARTYTRGEIGRVRVIPDFLPAPADLVPREENVQVTLSLSRRSLDFFKREAKKRRVPYQRMIRALVDRYAEREEGKGGNEFRK